jgi:hypothetical protein
MWEGGVVTNRGEVMALVVGHGGVEGGVWWLLMVEEVISLPFRP